MDQGNPVPPGHHSGTSHSSPYDDDSYDDPEARSSHSQPRSQFAARKVQLYMSNYSEYLGKVDVVDDMAISVVVPKNLLPLKLVRLDAGSEALSLVGPQSLPMLRGHQDTRDADYSYSTSVSGTVPARLPHRPKLEVSQAYANDLAIELDEPGHRKTPLGESFSSRRGHKKNQHLLTDELDKIMATARAEAEEDLPLRRLGPVHKSPTRQKPLKIYPKEEAKGEHVPHTPTGSGGPGGLGGPVAAGAVGGAAGAAVGSALASKHAHPQGPQPVPQGPQPGSHTLSKAPGSHPGAQPGPQGQGLASPQGQLPPHGPPQGPHGHHQGPHGAQGPHGPHGSGHAYPGSHITHPNARLPDKRQIPPGSLEAKRLLDLHRHQRQGLGDIQLIISAGVPPRPSADQVLRARDASTKRFSKGDLFGIEEGTDFSLTDAKEEDHVSQPLDILLVDREFVAPVPEDTSFNPGPPPPPPHKQVPMLRAPLPPATGNDDDDEYYDIGDPVFIHNPTTKRKPSRSRKRQSKRGSDLKPFLYATLVSLLESVNGTVIGEEFSKLNLPVKEKQLIEKIVDLLLRLTLDMVIDEHRYEVGIQRLEKALRVLEGFM